MDSIRLKTKELLTYHSGSHGNLVTIAMRYVPDAHYPLGALCEYMKSTGRKTKELKSNKVEANDFAISQFRDFAN